MQCAELNLSKSSQKLSRVGRLFKSYLQLAIIGLLTSGPITKHRDWSGLLILTGDMKVLRNFSPMGLATLAVGLVAVLFLVIVVADSDEDEGSTLDNGLGKHIPWSRLDDGLAAAKDEGKPLMLIIHKSWCGACKSLKPKFRDSQKIAKLSKEFIMVNTMDEDEPPMDIYKPDGGYVPRILFFDPEGELLKDVINEEGNPEYKYYYYDELSIVGSMEKVAGLFPASSKNMLNSDEGDMPDSKPDKSEL
ncbi:Thioredoxin domain-containing protein 12 [Orchesella cincta]|uniref:Thioredoxin domain-containing protein 12 n=1 Tax=Orchesella cincta TaxID=48709 RepID=A0A1D2NGS2_ORCCI|nr:Thioredoxin domain-containing protein 12 [Orchesella cincta]